jgi:adenylosuccinate synthase
VTTSATVVVDIGYGDSGKGTLTDALVRHHRADLVVRMNGGPQAAHTVVLPDGREHIFAQFGSGTLVGALSHMSRFTFIDPLALVLEANHLQELGIERPFSTLTIDPRCFLVTPIHRELNRLREERRGQARHGSCGRGFGEAVGYSLEWPSAAPTVKDLDSPRTLEWKLNQLQRHAQLEVDTYEPYDVRTLVEAYVKIGLDLDLVPDDEIIGAADYVVFEGAQAVLIDETHGIAPYHTWSNCTFDNALALCQESGITDVTKLGVTRAYMARHGRGPMPTESPALGTVLKEAHNTYNKWQEQMRVGHLDVPLLEYAVRMCRGVDQLAVTHLDRTEPLRLPIRREINSNLWHEDEVLLVRPRESIQQELSEALHAPVVWESRGPTFQDKRLMREGVSTVV